MKAADQLRTIPNGSNSLVDFCSNDYLGMAKNALPIEGPLEAATGARLLRGTLPSHLQLEKFCAEIFKSEACLLYNSGYQANVGVLSSLGQRNDTYLYDEACHASLKDGMRLSMAQRYSFKHNDIADLERRLRQTTGNRFIVVESLYSMDGDWCRLREIQDLAKQYGAWIVLDEAHSTGIVGTGGAGYAEKLGIENAVFLRILTFGKAVGGIGAVVAGAKTMCDYFVNRSRAWIYSTAMPGILAKALLSNLEKMLKMEAERAQILRLREELDRLLAINDKSGLQKGSPIVPILVEGNTEAKRFAKGLQQAGFDARAILAPTVAAGSERIRIVLHSFNTIDEVHGLAEVVKKLSEN